MKTLFLLLMTVACSSMKPQTDYRNSAQYQQKKELNASYFKPDDRHFSGKEIGELLGRKLDLPNSLKLAVVKLNHDSRFTTLLDHQKPRQQSQIVTEKNSDFFNGLQGKSKRIKEVAFVPELLMPKAQDLASLRDVAALMQAHLVLVISTRSQTDWDHNLVKRHEAKAMATVDAVVVDVRTGVIAFTSVASETAKIKEKEDDMSIDELLIRATIEAEDKALKEIVMNVGHYFG